jgi:hypothetical protein
VQPQRAVTIDREERPVTSTTTNNKVTMVLSSILRSKQTVGAVCRVAARPVRQNNVVVQQQVQKRNMSLGGHHGPPPDWQGIDKKVRAIFPEDYQRKQNKHSINSKHLPQCTIFYIYLFF